MAKTPGQGPRTTGLGAATSRNPKTQARPGEGQRDVPRGYGPGGGQPPTPKVTKAPRQRGTLSDPSTT